MHGALSAAIGTVDGDAAVSGNRSGTVRGAGRREADVIALRQSVVARGTGKTGILAVDPYAAIVVEGNGTEGSGGT